MLSVELFWKILKYIIHLTFMMQTFGTLKIVEILFFRVNCGGSGVYLFFVLYTTYPRMSHFSPVLTDPPSHGDYRPVGQTVSLLLIWSITW